MKYLIFSDLHGSIDSAQFIIRKFQELKCDTMICLGDVLYHGPRNDLPDCYNPKKVIELLNAYAKDILCIQGNCDAEVDQMVLEFPLYPFKKLMLNGIEFHLEHGHHLEDTKKDSKVVLYGHTHIARLEVQGNTYFVNPGSITLPKGNKIRSYLILEDRTLSLFDMKDNLLNKLDIK